MKSHHDERVDRIQAAIDGAREDRPHHGPWMVAGVLVRDLADEVAWHHQAERRIAELEHRNDARTA